MSTHTDPLQQEQAEVQAPLSCPQHPHGAILSDGRMKDLKNGKQMCCYDI